ncbi:MAG: hypothetical protein ABUL47_07430, partial [Leifsonia sp.]
MTVHEPQSPPPGELGDDAVRRDAAVPHDLDWSLLPAGSVTSRFAAPSGQLAVVSLGDPADPRVGLVPGV